MPQLGGKTGLINEAVNHHTNEQLTKAVEYMATDEYKKTRSTNPDDVIPTHRRQNKKLAPVLDSHLQVFSNEKSAREADDEEDGAHPDDHEDAEENEEDDEELAILRAQRAGKIKKEHDRMSEWQKKGHGTYREIVQDDFFGTVVREKGGSELVVVHFYHNDFERCKIIDKHLSQLAQMMMPIRFVKLDVEKSPFLVEKLRVHVLPCQVLFVNDVAVDRITGFEELELSDKGDDVDQESLKYRIEVGLGLKETE